MKNRICNGDVLDVTAPSGGTTSGLGVLIGSLFGVAVLTGLQGDVVPVHTTGVFDHIKEGAGSGQAFAAGDPVYWDDTNKRMTKTTTSNTKVGYAVLAALTTDVVIRVRLVPFA
jgi:predicted RecA/RadA family phage recombinase